MSYSYKIFVLFRYRDHVVSGKEAKSCLQFNYIKINYKQ